MFTFKIKFLLVLFIPIIVGLSLMPVLFELDGEEGSNFASLLGRFHILFLHFPICLLFIIPILEVLGKFPPLDYLKKSVGFLLYIGALFIVATSVLGFLLAVGDGDAGTLLEDHMWDGIIASGLVLLAIVLREMALIKNDSRAVWGYRVVLAFTLLTVAMGSHHGASMVHGEMYLVEKLPEGVKDALGIKEDKEPVLTYDSPAFDRLIKPIFEQNCYACHSDKKQKGKYRMDSMELLLAGGKSHHVAVTPGDLEESELHERIVLGRRDKGVMPPKEKSALSADNITLINWWIETGASADGSIADLSYEDFPEEVEVIIEDLIESSEGDNKLVVDEALFLSVSGSLKEKYGVDVFKHSQDLSEGLYVVTRNSQLDLPLAFFDELLPLAPYVRDIDFWKHQFETGGLASLSAYTQMHTLQLHQTNVTVEDLNALAGLRKLKVLNLYGTALKDDAIDVLVTLRSLKKLYVFNSGLTKEGIERLEKELPRCRIIKGVEFEEIIPKVKEVAKPKAVAADQAKASAVDGLLNLAITATASSPGVSDGESKGPQAAIDGTEGPFWDEVDGNADYRLKIALKQKENVSSISMVAYRHHLHAAKSFGIIIDGKVVKTVENAVYKENKLVVDFPEVSCSTLEIFITEYYGPSPAIRELGIYGQIKPVDLLNLALTATASSEGVSDGGSKGPQAAIDGSEGTFWDEVDGKADYRLKIALKQKEDVSSISMVAFKHHLHAAKTFDVIIDGKVVKRVKNAVYDKNKLIVSFPEVACNVLEIFITEYYGPSPAIRELGIYDEHKHVTKAGHEHEAVLRHAVAPEGVVTGEGNHKYKVYSKWAKFPKELPGSLHGAVVVDKAGLLYVSMINGAGILVFDKEGKVVKQFSDKLNGIHGMCLNVENGVEYIYGAMNSKKKVAKIALDGKLIWEIVGPPTIENVEYGKYVPTAVAVGPNGDIYVADGYGSNRINRYDKNQKYMGSFGSKGDSDGQFKTCHGISLDTRGKKPLLLVSDREHGKLHHFTLEGKFVKVIAEGLRRPCATSIKGEFVAIAELAARAVILNGKNEIVSRLGDNPNKKEWAKNGLPVKDWNNAYFSAPHGVCWGNDGDVYVTEWNRFGRLHKLEKVKEIAADEVSKAVILNGTGLCGKCELGEDKSCSNILLVNEGGKEVKYHLTSKLKHKEYFCTGKTEGLTVTGTVEVKDGKKMLTAKSIDKK